MPRPVVPSPPDGEITPTLDLPTVLLAHRLENQRPPGRPLIAPTREPACQDCSYEPMIDPMASGTAKRPSADLRLPPAGGRLCRPTLPPPLTTRPRGASNDGRRTPGRPRPS